jgi:hypothetical protein
MPNDILSPEVRGKTMRWSFTSGPKSGKTYEHVFADDGTVTFHEVGGEKKTDSAAAKKPAAKTKAKPTAPKYSAVEVVDGVELVSYMSNEGFTLTVALDFRDHKLVGVASGVGRWNPVAGTFEVVD